MSSGMRFEVLGRVPSGASGTVWKARDTGLDRIVALKEITGQSTAEAQALASVRSPHIVQAFGVVEDGGRVYLVEEWVDGATLGEVLRAAGQLSIAQALGVIRGALLGLADAHRAGLVHGDVSASNILVDRDGTSKLVDFGSVVRSGERARTSTGAYAAPEVLAGDVATPASDVYAAAAVLTTLLHGRRDTRPSTRGIGGEIRPVLDRALDGNPAGRYRDAAEFLAALEEAAQRRYGPAWFSAAGLGALATAASAGLISAGLAAVPFGGSTVAGAGTSAAAAPASSIFGAAPAGGEPLADVAAATATSRRTVWGALRTRTGGVLAGAAVVVAAAVAVLALVLSSGGGLGKPAADVIHSTTSAPRSQPPPAPQPTATLSQAPTLPPTTPPGSPVPSSPGVLLPSSVPSTVPPIDVNLTAGRATISYQVQECDGCTALQTSGSVPLSALVSDVNFMRAGVLAGGVTDGVTGSGDVLDLRAPLRTGTYQLIGEEPGQPAAVMLGVRIPYADPAVNKRSGGGLVVVGGLGQEAPSNGCQLVIATADPTGFSGSAQCSGLSVSDGQYVVSLSATFEFTP